MDGALFGCVTSHVDWVFEERKLPPVQALVKVILSVFASHLRRPERLWCTSAAKTQTFRWFQSHLLRFDPYASFYQ